MMPGPLTPRNKGTVCGDDDSPPKDLGTRPGRRYLSIYHSIYLSIYLSIFLSIRGEYNPKIYLDINIDISYWYILGLYSPLIDRVDTPTTRVSFLKSEDRRI